MAQFTITSFTDGEIPGAAKFNNNLTGITDQLNGNLDNTNLELGALDQDIVNTVTSAVVPLTLSNGSQTTDIFICKDNTTHVFNVKDGGNIVIKATARIFLDGSAGSGSDTYIYESAADTIDLVAGGAVGLSVGALNIAIRPTGKIFLDSGNDTYIQESPGNSVVCVAGGVTALSFDNDSTAGNTRILIRDNDNAALERVTVGAADSGGAGFKVLRIPN